MKEKITPLPWKLWIKEMTIVCGGCSGDWHCEPTPYTKEDKANAAYIVKCVNNFEKMREALEDILSMQSGGKKSCGHDYNCVCVWDKARAVLAEIKDEK